MSGLLGYLFDASSFAGTLKYLWLIAPSLVAFLVIYVTVWLFIRNAGTLKFLRRWSHAIYCWYLDIDNTIADNKFLTMYSKTHKREVKLSEISEGTNKLNKFIKRLLALTAAYYLSQILPSFLPYL